MKKPIAVISDVHGNLPALKNVLAAIDSLGIQDLICLGDTVGYGPDPINCLKTVVKRCGVILMGNHEMRIIRPGRAHMNPAAAFANDWTREELRSANLLRILHTFPTHFQMEDLLFVHGTPKDSVRDYLLEQDYMGYSNFDTIARSLEEDFKEFRLCFVGHNHLPFLATGEGFIHPHEHQSRFIVEDQKLYVSVGSVGQPRDGNPKSSFVTYDGHEVVFHRVAYPIEKTQAQFKGTGLPIHFSDRLEEGR